MNSEKVIMNKDEYETVHRLLLKAIANNKNEHNVVDELVIINDLLYSARSYHPID